jgi:transposase, IS5 family
VTPRCTRPRRASSGATAKKAHIGVDAESGLVHSVTGTAANVNDVVAANSLLHADERDVFADAGYQGAHKRPDAKPDVNWHVAMRPGKRRALDKSRRSNQLIDQLERLKASVRAKVEHPFRVIKRQFGHVKVRYRGLKKNTAQLKTLFALSNLWMVRGKLAALGG